MHECAYRVWLLVATVSAYITSKWNLLCTSQPCWYRHEKLLTGEINQVVGWPDRAFFKIRQKLLFSTKVWWPSGWVEVDWWRIQLAIDTMREFMLFLVALINNWWLHGRSEIQFLQVAEGGLGGKDIAKTISSSFFPVHRIQLQCTPRNCNAL